MDTSESDSDALTKPKFNSTVLGPDELPHSLGGDATTGGQHALNLSPIPKHRARFLDTSSIPASEQQCDTAEEVSQGKLSEIEQEDETSSLSSLTGPKQVSFKGEKGDEVVKVESSKNSSSLPSHQKSDSMGRSHVTNPFESDLLESLCTTTFSPSLFERSKKDEGTPEKSFRWSIGQMAELHPADIDETEPMCQSPDPTREAQIASAIDKFWASQKYIMPSPQLKESANSEAMSSPDPTGTKYAKYQESRLARPIRRRSSGSQRSVEVQTMFAFPPNLDLIGLLGNRFQYEEGEVAVFEANLSLDTLRRKLFVDTIMSQSSCGTEGDCSRPVDVNDYDSGSFRDERPSWYHSDDEEDKAPTRKLSFDGITDPDDEAEISARFASPDVSPIKK